MRGHGDLQILSSLVGFLLKNEIELQALNSDPIAAWSTRDKLTIAAYWARDQYGSLKMYRNPDRTELAKARQAWFDAEAILSRAGGP